MPVFKKLGNLLRKSFTGGRLGSGGWFPFFVREPYPGAWQQNIELSREDILAYHPIFACITLIASDISKLPLRLKRQGNGIWLDASDTLIPVIKKPNSLQSRNQFFENWLNSKLSSGNTYVFKKRTTKGKVSSLHILDPSRINPIISDDGEVFYQVSVDNVSGIKEAITVPATDIIHDRFNCLYHPLVGLPPIYACAMAAAQGTAIMKNSTSLFVNGGKPGGVIEIPGKLSPDAARELKEAWESSYGGENAGKTAVLTESAKYNPASASPADSQLVEQLGLTAEICCSVFHVPLYKIGLGDVPSYNNVEALDQQYYSQCLQSHIEAIEVLLAEGLDLPENHKIEFDLNALLRMDTSTRFKTYNEGIKGGWLSPNEVRKKENLRAVEGGDTPYLQQQNYSLAALSQRDNNLKKPKGSAPQPAEPQKSLTESEKRACKLTFKGIITK
ncbi:phage portal protein [Arsenophonus nasoniae]|uniref:Phage portal protein n=1 Tax=Arsenophonus nasoniae TaxID=638 RepID=A0AA95K4K7_9GAMM|nr:phage portal protein [Arsenophonus nasoniae]WGL93773.1 phage portal protein [Arsenophonus nasoniae]WGL96015.1 phage portal protein [Arsenophonus nasoniae]